MNDCKDEKKEKSGISADLKLFLVFFFGQGFIEPFIFRFKIVEYRIVYAVILSGILIGLSIWHKIYNRWKWPGISISNVFTVLFCLVIGTGILAHWANDLLNMPPWYQGDIRNIPFNALYLIKAAILQKFIFLVPVGFLIFYILICLNLVTINKDDFSAYCRNPRPFIKKNLIAEIWKFLKNSVSTKICSPTGKKQSFFAKIISELESPREFKFEKTEKTVEVSFYIVRAEIIKNTWRNFLLLGCIIVLFVVLVNHVFIGWMVDGAPLMPLYKLLFSISLGAMGAVVFGIFIYMYCLCI
ncbi:MAG: hypothetical protein GY749_25240 [Desulfobacteraceae bacterium]|nr:hypothetical protein [Desulfobacteraceae bacterium]